jgi:predicted metal-binding membrane protein
MRLFPSERDKQRSDRRTVRLFFAAMAVLTWAYLLTLAVHRLLTSW